MTTKIQYEPVSFHVSQMSNVQVALRVDWLNDITLKDLFAKALAEMKNRGFACDVQPKPTVLPHPAHLAALNYAEEQLVEFGHHIQAIKAYKQRTATSLREAKDVCDAYRSSLPSYQTKQGPWVGRQD